MTERFPTLLIVAEYPPNVADGGGALTRQMLKDYPAEKLHWWSCLPGRESDFGQAVQNMFRFTLPVRLYPNQRGRRVKAWLIEKVWVPAAARHLAAVAAAVKPDQVWVVLHGWPILVAERIGLIQTHRCHVSVWDYQDHESSWPRFGTRERVAQVTRAVDQMYLTANTADAVSRPMHEDLERRTGRQDAVVVHSGVEPEQLGTIGEMEPPDNEETRIAYAGAIVTPGTFEFFVRALESVRPRLGKPVRLEFFGGHVSGAEPWFNPDWMRMNGTFNEARLNQALRRCDWGFMPMGIHDENPRYNRFSIPNKFGTYLAAGLPLLVVGHGDSSTARIVREYEAGFWTDQVSLLGLQESLLSVLGEREPRARYRDAILRCAREEFDAASIRHRLWRCWGARP